MKHYFLFFLLALAIFPLAAQEKAAPNLALQCLVNCSNGEKAEAAVDGVRNGHFWETPLTSTQPAWLELDLGEVRTLKKLHLFLWWGSDKRYYQYFIEISADRKLWHCVVDQRENTLPTDEQGQEFLLPGQAARFIRLTLFSCSVNNSGHVRELEIY